MRESYYLFIFIVITAVCQTFTKIYSQQWVNAGFVNNPGSIPSISVVNNDIVWIVGGNGDTAKAFRTTNGGMNWQSLPVTGIPHALYCVTGIDMDLAFAGEGVVSGHANLYKTTNGGQNWISIFQTLPNRGFFNGLVFTKYNNYLLGIALAERIYRSSNSGVNWVEVNAGVNGVSNAHNSLFIVDNQFYGFGMNNGVARVRLTTDNGLVWTTYTLNITGNYTSAIAFHLNKLIGVAATSTSLPIIARTTNGGLTWNQVDIGAGITGECHFCWVENTNIVYIVGENGVIKKSTNGGLNWIVTPTPVGVTGIKHFDFINYGQVIYGYAVSSNGNVIKLADSVLLTGIKTFQKIPDKFSLSQNYPNPFNLVTKFDFSLPEHAIVNLIILNILGQEVKRIVNNESINSGTYTYDFDASDLPSGVYYYKLTAGDYSEIRKLTLLK
jgi:photosystem II stability/assembly factor-like uncharacterized protein